MSSVLTSKYRWQNHIRGSNVGRSTSQGENRAGIYGINTACHRSETTNDGRGTMRRVGYALFLVAAMVTTPAVAGGWGHGGWGHGGWGHGGWGGWGHRGGVSVGFGFGFPAFGFYGSPAYYYPPPYVRYAPPPPPVYQQPAVYESPPPPPVYEEPVANVAPPPPVHRPHRHRVVQHKRHCCCCWVDP